MNLENKESMEKPEMPADSRVQNARSNKTWMKLPETGFIQVFRLPQCRQEFIRAFRNDAVSVLQVLF